MKGIIKVIVLMLTGTIFSGLCMANDGNLKKFPLGCSPKEVGERLSARYLKGGIENIKTKRVTYPEVCTWLGALRFAKISKNKELATKLEKRYYPLLGKSKQLVPLPDHVDFTVFGAIPLELYLQTGNLCYYHIGIDYADKQWVMPENTQQTEAYKLLFDKGLSWQTRFWIDDMFMITTIQLQAFLATKNRKYIDRAAYEMTVYLDSLQCPNSLFYHAGDVPFFWGRGNGWMAVGMTELLKNLPADHVYREQILLQYQKMMNTLKEYQRSDGMWGQLIDDPESWSETSGTAMFTYAMITGVKRGWLSEEQFAPVAKKAWIALVSNIDEKGAVKNVCEGTNKLNSRQYYLDRKRNTGDMHGQAPALWCTTALLE